METSFENPVAIAIGDIVALHEQGLSPGEIAVRLGTTQKVIYGRLTRVGLIPHGLVTPPSPPPSPPTTEDIVALHKKGLSPFEIAARLGTSKSVVRSTLRENGLTPYSPLHARRIAKSLGLSSLQEEIGEKLGRRREERLAPSSQEAQNTLRAIDEIIRLAKEGIPRYEIAKRTGSNWTLVAEALERADIKPVWPACGELTDWSLTLLPILDEIRKAHPNTEPIVTKAEQLEKEIVDISDATWTVEGKLPLRGKGVEKERWCVGDISQVASSNLDYIDPLKGCLEQLDVAKLPKRVEQAETCIINICDTISSDVRRVAKPVSLHSSEAVRVGIGDSVCDKYTGSCGPILDIIDDEVLIEPTTRKKVGKEYLETAEPPVRAKKINLTPDHITRYEAAKPKEVEVEEANINKELLLDIIEHETAGGGMVLYPARAEATPCKCFSFESNEYCWSPGILGLISSKKNPEQIARYCAIGKTPAGEGVKERFGKIKGAIEEAHREWEKKGKGLESWWGEVAKSLKKHEVEL